MIIDIKKQNYNKIEILLSDYKLDEDSDWDNLKAKFIYALAIEHQEITLLSMRANKESLLYELGNPLEYKDEGMKFLVLHKQAISLDECTLIAEDYEFYLGGFFITFANYDSLIKEGFIKHLFSNEMGYKFTNLEYIFMSHDGEMINWVNPSNSDSILKELEVIKVDKNV